MGVQCTGLGLLAVFQKLFVNNLGRVNYSNLFSGPLIIFLFCVCAWRNKEGKSEEADTTTFLFLVLSVILYMLFFFFLQVVIFFFNFF